MKYTRRRTLKKQLKSTWVLEPFVFCSFFIYTIAQTLFLTVGVIMPRFILNKISEGGSLDDVIKLISIMGVSLIVSGGIAKYFDETSKARLVRVRLFEFNNFFKYYFKTKYKYSEDPKWQDEVLRSTSTLNNDNTGFQATLTYMFTTFAMIFSCSIYIYFLTKFNYLIVVITITGIIVSLLLGKLSKDYAFKKDDELRRKRRKLNYYISTTSDFSFTKDIRIYSLKDKILNFIKKENKSYSTTFNKIKRKELFYSIFDVLILVFIQSITFYFVINDKTLQAGDIALYLSASLVLSTSLKTVTTNITKTYEYLGHTTKYYNLITSQEYLNTNDGIKEGLDETFKIEFKNVYFKYPNTTNYVLENLNFTINKGEKIAIVGHNGAGKTTIVKLIAGLFEVECGQILINNININQYNKEYLYKNFSVVFQEINIYAFTILENISLKPAEVSDINFAYECLDRVGLKDKVMSLPNQIMTPMLKIIDESGVEFSGGESQKLTIARALYTKGKCVILDEPTAALDALAEEQIYKDFNNLINNNTAIYISHRLASTKFCDRIMLFTKDGLKETGNHNELMKLKGIYYEMFVTQGKYYQEGSDI